MTFHHGPIGSEVQCIVTGPGHFYRPCHVRSPRSGVCGSRAESET